MLLAWSKKGHGNGISSDFWSVTLQKKKAELVIIIIIRFFTQFFHLITSNI